MWYSSASKNDPYLIAHERSNGASDLVVALPVALWTQHEEQKPGWNGNLPREGGREGRRERIKRDKVGGDYGGW